MVICIFQPHQSLVTCVQMSHFTCKTKAADDSLIILVLWPRISNAPTQNTSDERARQEQFLLSSVSQSPGDVLEANTKYKARRANQCPPDADWVVINSNVFLQCQDGLRSHHHFLGIHVKEREHSPEPYENKPVAYNGKRSRTERKTVACLGIFRLHTFDSRNAEIGQFQLKLISIIFEWARFPRIHHRCLKTNETNLKHCSSYPTLNPADTRKSLIIANSVFFLKFWSFVNRANYLKKKRRDLRFIPN